MTVRGKVINWLKKVLIVIRGFICPPVIGQVAKRRRERETVFMRAPRSAGKRAPDEKSLN
jgi:hypothetical protein